MRLNKIGLLLIVICLCFCLTGCFRMFGSTQPTVLLPEDRMFTAPKGKPYDLLLDNKPINITFTQDMKVVSPATIQRHEGKLNKETLRKIKVTKQRNAGIGILGSLLAIISALLRYFMKKKKR